MALFDKLFGTTESAPAKTEREEKLQKLIREGNEYMRQHQDDNYAVLMQKEAEIEGSGSSTDDASSAGLS